MDYEKYEKKNSTGATILQVSVRICLEKQFLQFETEHVALWAYLEHGMHFGSKYTDVNSLWWKLTKNPYIEINKTFRYRLLD